MPPTPQQPWLGAFPNSATRSPSPFESACPSPPAAEIARLAFDSAHSGKFSCPRLSRRIKAAQGHWNDKDKLAFAELLHKALSLSLSIGPDRPESPIPPLDKGQPAALLARLQTMAGAGGIMPPGQRPEQIAARFGIADEYFAAFAACESRDLAGLSAPAPKAPKPRI